MATYALIDKNGVLLQERAFSAFPAQPNPVKGFQWYALTEVTPSLTEAQKIGDYTLSIDAKNSTVTKTYMAVSKSAAELAAIQDEKDLAVIAAELKKAESLDIKSIADITDLIKGIAKGLNILIKKG